MLCPHLLSTRLRHGPKPSRECRLVKHLAQDGDANLVKLAPKLSDCCGIVLVPVMAAQCELGLLVVLKGDESPSSPYLGI